MNARNLSMSSAAALGAALLLAAEPAFAQAVAPKWQVPHLRRVRRHHRADDVRHLPRGEAREDRGRFLRRGRRRLGPAERLGDRRRLSVGRLVPRHRRADLALRLRRVHVFGRLAGRLYHRAAGDRGAVPQHRQVHDGRHPRLPQQPEDRQDLHGDFHHHRVDVLPHGADGRRRRAGEDADRHRLRDLGDRRGRPDARVRDLRRHGGHHLRADHQGDAAGDRLAGHGVLVWSQYGFGGRRTSSRWSAIRRSRRGSRRSSATRPRT